MCEPEPAQAGTDFPPSVKQEARQRAAFKCCYCRERMGDDVHHLTPKEEGGQGVIENAVLLCAQCHRDYGDRRDKRVQLRQARGDWYEIVGKRHQSPSVVEALAFVQDLATKNDVQALMLKVDELSESLKAGIAVGTTTAPELANVAFTMVNSIAPQPTFRGWSPGTWVPGTWEITCGNCGKGLVGGASFCAFCGRPVAATS